MPNGENAGVRVVESHFIFMHEKYIYEKFITQTHTDTHEDITYSTHSIRCGPFASFGDRHTFKCRVYIFPSVGKSDVFCVCVPNNVRAILPFLFIVRGCVHWRSNHTCRVLVEIDELIYVPPQQRQWYCLTGTAGAMPTVNICRGDKNWSGSTCKPVKRIFEAFGLLSVAICSSIPFTSIWLTLYFLFFCLSVFFSNHHNRVRCSQNL